ncbi:MAG TPA: hypothetical protein VIX19_17155 [Terriglobales bacterium]
MLTKLVSKQLRLAAALAAMAACAPQAPQILEGLTPEKLAAGMRIYLRDSAEFPLHMDMVLVATDSSGQVRQRKKGSANYDFHGYNPRSNNSGGQLRGSKGTFPAAENALLGGILPSFAVVALSAGAQPVTSEDSVAGLVTAKIEQPGCGEFEWSSANSMPKRLCGSMEFQLKESDLSLVRFSYQAGGLPITTVVKPFGKCQLQSYRVEAEYQQVSLPGDPKPFLVPRRLEAKVETDKGGLVMTSQFAPRK